MPADVVVVGAGVAGLMAASRLVSSGCRVVVLDKGRSVGGRLATRRMDGAVLDHGAQFFTARSDEFGSYVHEWIAHDVVTEWCRGFAGREDGFARYRANAGMNALAKFLARGLDVRTSTLAFRVQPDGARWSVQDDTGARMTADAVIVATPVPQAVALCVDVRDAVPQPLWQLSYEPTLALLVVLDGPSALPQPGGVQDADDTFSFVADNGLKGISVVPALTAHAGHVWSRAHWDDDHRDVHRELLARARPWIGSARVIASQVKRWRLASPTTVWPDRCCVIAGAGPLVFAGDAYAGPKVEGAALSGLAAARAVVQAVIG